MIRFSKIHLPGSVLAVGGMVLGGALIAFTNPKTVHAVAAALVEVTNTAANPVVTQGTNAQAAQIINLICPLSQNPEYLGVCQTVTNGPHPTVTNYEIPAGSVFVLTSVDVSVLPPCNGYEIGLDNSDANGNGTAGAALPFVLAPPPSTGVTYQFRYPSGWKFYPVSGFSYIGLSSIEGCSALFTRVSGYVTSS